MFNCLLFSLAVAFPVMNWRYEPAGVLQSHHLQNVSIFMLRREPPPEGLSYNLDITDEIRSQGWSEKNTSLVTSSWPIYEVK